MTTDLVTLQMALVGYELEKQKIESKIRELQAALKGRTAALPAAQEKESAPSAKRILSPAARKRIAMAQKKRWAEHRKRAAAAKAGKSA
jgi:hypothetical protein